MNFHPPYIVHSKTCKLCYVDVLAENNMERMRGAYRSASNHSILKIWGSKIGWFNIRSYNGHKEDYLTERMDDERFATIKQYVDGLTGIYKDTNHSLVLCCNTAKVKFVKDFWTVTKLEIYQF